MILKIIFTWWNKQTFGTFLKTLFTGILVGKDEFGNKYYKNKNDDRWVVYSKNVEATKIPQTGIFGCIEQSIKSQMKKKKNIHGKKTFRE